MKVSKVAASTARRIFTMCATDGRMDEDKLRTAIRKIASSKPRDYRGILTALQRLVRVELARRHVTVQSATELDSATAEQVKSKLISKFGDDLTFEFSVRPELLGGLRIKVGDDVWDSSVDARIKRFAQSF